MVNNGKSLITVDNIEILNRVLNRIPSSVLKCNLLGNPRTSHGGFFAGKINKWSWFPEGFFLPILSHWDGIPNRNTVLNIEVLNFEGYWQGISTKIAGDSTSKTNGAPGSPSIGPWAKILPVPVAGMAPFGWEMQGKSWYAYVCVYIYIYLVIYVYSYIMLYMYTVMCVCVCIYNIYVQPLAIKHGDGKSWFRDHRWSAHLRAQRKQFRLLARTLFEGPMPVRPREQKTQWWPPKSDASDMWLSCDFDTTLW